jgi:predicted nucleotidyltransferase
LGTPFYGQIEYTSDMKKVEDMRGFRDRDFLQTREKFFFCVVSPFHPSDRVISYLKYVPSKLGVWGRGEERFKRVMRAYTIPNLLETFSVLERSYPHYLFYSPVYNITMTAVPHEYVMKHFKPEEKLAQLFQTSHLDSLQRKLLRLVSFLAEASNVSLNSFGVTGSILLDIHRPEFSDFDITVYGLKDSLAVKNALTEAYSSSSSMVQCFKEKALKAWCAKKARRYPLTPDEALKIYERKWNLGVFEDTLFSIHPVKLEHELVEQYGDKVYHPLGVVAIRAVVCENADYMFLPAVYRVRDVKVVDGPSATDIEEVVSYESLYDNLAEVGETILVRGKLERVLDKKTGQKYHRVLVGSPEGKGMEYIKLA